MNVLDKNLTALDRTAPAMAQRIRGISPEEGERLIWEPSKKSPVPTLKVHPGNGGDPRYIVSQYDPQREIERWISANAIDAPTNLIFAGIGIGLHILRYLQAYPVASRHILILEKDAALCRAALSFVDLSETLGSPHAHLLIDPPPEDIGGILEPFRTDFVLHNLKVLRHQGSIDLHQDYYNELLYQLADVLNRDQVSVRTALGQRGMNQFNLFCNLVAFWIGRKPCDVYQLFKGYPGFVVAAGPSLDKNVHELKRVGDRGVIVAVDTAQNTLKGHGIRPDFVVAADPTELNFSHFEKIDSLGDTFLAVHPESCHLIIEKYASHPYFLTLRDEGSAFLEYLMPSEGPEDMIPRGMMVGQVAYNLVKHMGCDPIVIIGMDLAFSRDGGTTHAKQAAVSRTVTAPDREGKASVDAKEGKIGQESGKVLWVEAQDGGYVPTTASFKTYITEMQKFIAQTEAEVINATEGGALIRGAKLARLAETIDTLRSPGGVKAMMDRLRAPAEIPDPQTALDKILDARDIMHKSREKIFDAGQWIQRWPAMLEAGSIPPQTVQKEWETLNNLWLAAVSEPVFNAVLSQSIIYLYFLRQRSDKLLDDRPETFLRTMYEKYNFILSEMYINIQEFTKVLDMVVENFERLTELYNQHKQARGQ